jgi:hypothetical protein
MDESSPQTTANTQRLWSFGKPIIHKNTDKIKANAFGCYLLNGASVIDFKEHSKKEDVSEFLITIRQKNPIVNAGLKVLNTAKIIVLSPINIYAPP